MEPIQNEPVVILKAPAKVNLRLKIVGKRENGYHELVSVMCPVSVYDTLTLDFSVAEVSITCPHPDVPEDETNICIKAVRAFEKAAGLRAGVNITLEKEIPVGAGLGGGSSDGASVLMALNERFGHPLDEKALHAMALSLGADVPFFLMKKPALAQGIGEVLTPIEALPGLPLVIVYPGVFVSTKAVYEALNFKLTLCKKTHTNFKLYNGLDGVLALLENDLEAAAMTGYPIIGEVKQALLKAGALGVLMSGSGSSVFGLFKSQAEAKRAARLMEKPGHRVFAARLLSGAKA